MAATTSTTGTTTAGRVDVLGCSCKIPPVFVILSDLGGAIIDSSIKEVHA